MGNRFGSTSKLGVSLPDAPLREFEQRIADLPRTTKAERLVVQRIGQDIFRDRLLDYWQGRCTLTGISDQLRASRGDSILRYPCSPHPRSMACCSRRAPS